MPPLDRDETRHRGICYSPGPAGGSRDPGYCYSEGTRQNGLSCAGLGVDLHFLPGIMAHAGQQQTQMNSKYAKHFTKNVNGTGARRERVSLRAPAEGTVTPLPPESLENVA